MDQKTVDTSNATGTSTRRLNALARLSSRGAAAQQFFGKLLPRSAQDIEGGTVTIEKPVTSSSGRGYFWTFLVVVIVPSIAGILYVVFFASDQYYAEARFAVRTAQSDGASNKEAMATTSAASSGMASIPSIAGQDPYIVTSYLHSRAVIDDLAKVINIREIFRRPEADFWARLKSDATTEEVLRYWNSVVTTFVDGPSAIVTVRLRTFRAEDSLALLQAVITLSEKLVNEVSARARRDAMERAEADVRRYEAQVRDALVGLRQFRDDQGFIDPQSSATNTSKLLMSLLSEKIKIQGELFVALRAMSEDAPSVRSLRSRADALDKQIEETKASLTANSPDARTISASIVRYEELELKRIFSEKLYTMAQSALERARAKAERQNLYISVFVPPALPEYSEYPKRISLSFIFPVVFCVLWGIFALIFAAIEDHRL